MHLTLYTDYALRVLVQVGLGGGRLVTIAEIAQRHGISRNHLTKVVNQLGHAGFLETVRGKFGGIRLLRPAENIRLGDVVRSAEADFALVRCMRTDCTNSCLLKGACVARSALSAGLNAFFTELDRHTLADMIRPHRQAAE